MFETKGTTFQADGFYHRRNWQAMRSSTMFVDGVFITAKSGEFYLNVGFS